MAVVCCYDFRLFVCGNDDKIEHKSPSFSIRDSVAKTITRIEYLNKKSTVNLNSSNKFQLTAEQLNSPQALQRRVWQLIEIARARSHSDVSCSVVFHY